ncbi:peroxisomal N(1)-acetyl-spermine/spermidine oxidase [Brienomyrus brachyistius]|uniref:peroxisomal N(1)-acetyl-spermine/spermidine oxidase n=1 Tax=Brienomyrus brachyistius TaxID=42636 RepID=UPI0020B32C4D|nr:peroxisomal N(1)-acetyl-spermine/spermidine oxidase [Brienomyrus brachyistius]
MAFLQGLDSHIVVVGCGISGVGAAQKLLQHGFHNVRVLEATGRSGGRVKTGCLGSNIVEIGANWIHGPSQENPVFRLACQYGLLDKESMTEENQAIDVAGHPPFTATWLSSSGHQLEPEQTEPVSLLYMSLLEQSQAFYRQGREPMPSVGEFIKREVRLALGDGRGNPVTVALKRGVVNTLLKAECCVSGTHTMDDVALGAFGMYKTLPGLDCTFPGGYEGLIHEMMQTIPKGMVSYNKPIRCIHWNNSDGRAHHSGRTFPVLVECEDGDTFPADHVIITVSLGYLKKHHETLFRPQLPAQKAESIQRMGFGTNNKIFVEFDQPFWEPDCEIIFLLWEDESTLADMVTDVKTLWVKKLFGFTVLRPAERYGHMLCGWIAGRESEHMETLSEAEVKLAITRLIQKFTGNPTITPKRIVRSQWFHDPYTCGAYTYVASGCSGHDIDTLAEPLPSEGPQAKSLQVLFAGEATNKSFFSTVHGALEAGWREAQRLITHYTPPAYQGPLGSKL